ncbi:SusC/RagA family TonB-linked outer membrane protein [Sinomicrobium kalidii]|uniref:SusC/RagA family TonB-linked outer membrane protein n=1 Tax=Sinomicrobium kalidii TaxID=2900738 RepID=UPI001E5C7D93|nr:SusC/RagA family TonB-linked outer membrane protein [Sinomicrobium kalidii]UGU14323.1 SusC/RagA family TonB-linked outer membrane protein [Sinomicrobium kalidii]
MKRILVMSLCFLFMSVLVYGQEGTVTGTVVSKKDQTPLPGVNILVVGEPVGTSTDFDGNYTIEVSEGQQLQFSYLGFVAHTVTVGSESVIDVQLEEDASQLDEVVVTALGISREKKALGYAVTELKSEEINTIKDHNVANSLVGKVAGVVVNQSGGVGSGSRITIRGNNSITGNNQALIVVDGIPIDATGADSGGDVYSSTVTGGGITDINPEDVESVSILKGPNAAALYGSRAGNGVILITTKKGSKGQGLGISVNSNVTLENVMFLPDYQNIYGQGTNGVPYPNLSDMGGASWGSELDGSQQLYYTGEERAYNAQPDNVKDFFETGLKSINSLSIEKGGDAYSVRFSYTNNNTTSVIPDSKLNSHSFNLRGLVDLTDKLSFDGKATYFTQELNNRVSLGSEGVLAYVYYMPRNIRVKGLKNYQMENPSVYDPQNGLSDYDVISYAGQGKSTGNPYWMLNKDTNDERRSRFLGFAKLNYQFNDWLSAFIRIGSDVTNIRTDLINQVGHHFNRYGSLAFGTSKNTELNADFLFSVNKDLSEKLNLSANVGGNLSKRTNENMSVSGRQFKIPTRALLANTSVQTSTHTPLSVKKVNSLYGAFSFAYDDFVYLDLTARNDWSSTLPKDNRSFFYPSASFSVLADRFLDPEKNTFDLFKLRAGWAEVGNDTDPYQLRQTFSISQQGYLGLTVLDPPNVKANANLKPESVKSLEFGVEARMFGNRLYADFSVYRIVTNDLIFDVPVNPATGYNFFRENVGETENKGVELLIGGVPVRNEDFSWDIAFNFSRNKNRLNKLIDGLDSYVFNTSNSGNVSLRAQVDGAIGDIYGTTWKTDENGNLLVNAEGRPVQSTEQEHLGNSQPDWIGGLTNTFSYKNFSFRFLVDARIGGEIYSATSAALDGNGVSERSLLYRDGGVVVDAINEGTGEQNAENITAQEYWSNYSGIAAPYIYDQTNVRLREFSLNYNVPKSFVQKLGLNSASLGLIGRNLFFFYKKAKDIDPDATLGTGLTGQGISLNNVPTVRSLGVNVNLKF